MRANRRGAHAHGVLALALALALVCTRPGRVRGSCEDAMQAVATRAAAVDPFNKACSAKPSDSGDGCTFDVLANT